MAQPRREKPVRLWHAGIQHYEDLLVKLPMREKYVDEAVGIWIIFGVDPAAGNADVNNGTNDVFCGLPYAVAEKACDAQRRFREELYSLLCK